MDQEALRGDLLVQPAYLGERGVDLVQAALGLLGELLQRVQIGVCRNAAREDLIGLDQVDGVVDPQPQRVGQGDPSHGVEPFGQVGERATAGSWSAVRPKSAA